ncbi:protein-tyrosine phosphatase [Geodermatophilus ruber]|uniref:Protein-tyrosine phosphatase n=1 Tax=Geodermatophilus ruber TaxID=504800 RepID=A0A1I4DF51_9ACTN|nr:protein-tyrosine phosphatase [Geodermatophilus ruber]
MLLVCTGNICRSALAERLGRAYLDEVLGPDAGAIRLVSAGTRAVVGSAMHPDTALVLTGLGGDAGDFTARQLADRMVMDADLVLTMTRQHRRDVLELAPRALSRTFTLREAAGLLEHVDQDVPREEFAERACALVGALAAARSRRRSSSDDDVPDPIGQPVEAHAEAGELIAPALIEVLSRLAALRAEGAAVGP